MGSGVGIVSMISLRDHVRRFPARDQRPDCGPAGAQGRRGGDYRGGGEPSMVAHRGVRHVGWNASNAPGPVIDAQVTVRSRSGSSPCLWRSGRCPLRFILDRRVTSDKGTVSLRQWSDGPASGVNPRGDVAHFAVGDQGRSPAHHRRAVRSLMSGLSAVSGELIAARR